MKDKPFNVITKILAVILGVLIVINLYIALFMGVPFQQQLADILFSLTAVFAIFYIMVGCTKKEGAKYYRGFMIAHAITMLIIVYVNRARAPFSFFFNLIIYGCLCILASAKDLGEFKSKLFAYTITVLSIVTLLFGFDTAKATFVANMCRALRLGISVALLVMVIAKYKDKESRNTK